MQGRSSPGSPVRQFSSSARLGSGRKPGAGYDASVSRQLYGTELGELGVGAELDETIESIKQAFMVDISRANKWFQARLKQVVDDKDMLVASLTEENKRLLQEQQALKEENMMLRSRLSYSALDAVSLGLSSRSKQNTVGSKSIGSPSYFESASKLQSQVHHQYKVPARSNHYTTTRSDLGALKMSDLEFVPKQHQDIINEIDLSLRFSPRKPVHSEHHITPEEPSWEHLVRNRAGHRAHSASSSLGGRNFFHEAKEFLTESSFQRLLHHMKLLNKGAQTRSETLQAVSKLFQLSNAKPRKNVGRFDQESSGQSLFHAFESLLDVKTASTP